MELADRILRAIQDPVSGIRAWRLHVNESRRLSLGVKDRQVGNPHVPPTLSESAGAHYLMIWEDGRISRGQFERGRLLGDPAEALSHARAAAYDDPDAAQVLGPAAVPDVELYDATAARTAGGDTTLLSRRLDSIRRRIEQERHRTWSASLSAGEGRTRLRTSAGFDEQGRGSTMGWHLTINGAIGDGFSARAPEPDAEFESRLDRLMDLARELETPSKPMQPGVHPVLMHPRVVEEYALDTLLHNLAGSVVSNGEGHFRKEEFGADRSVLREDLSLRVDPLQPLKSGSYRFTGEGVPAAACTFIEGGRLIQPLLGLKYARRLSMKPTPMPYGSDTMSFGGSARLSLAQALAAAAGGAMVLSVLGVHTQDNTSGDFSLSAPQTLRIGDQGYAGHLRATISGNLFAILNSDALQFVEFPGETTPGLLYQGRLDPS